MYILIILFSYKQFHLLYYSDQDVNTLQLITPCFTKPDHGQKSNIQPIVHQSTNVSGQSDKALDSRLSKLLGKSKDNSRPFITSIMKIISSASSKMAPIPWQFDQFPINLQIQW